MKTYGIGIRDRGCCLGHDKYPTKSDKCNNVSRATHNRRKRAAKKRARQLAKREIRIAILTL